MTLARKADRKGALREIRKALEIEPTFDWAHRSLVELLPKEDPRKLGSELGSWIDFLERARESRPESGRIVQGLALLRSLAGKGSEVVADLEGALDRPGAGGSPALLGRLRRALLPDLPTYASIEAAISPMRETLLDEGAEWRWLPGRQEPSPALEWTTPSFDDAS